MTEPNFHHLWDAADRDIKSTNKENSLSVSLHKCNTAKGLSWLNCNNVMIRKVLNYKGGSGNGSKIRTIQGCKR